MLAGRTGAEALKGHSDGKRLTCVVDVIVIEHCACVVLKEELIVEEHGGVLLGLCHVHQVKDAKQRSS